MEAIAKHDFNATAEDELSFRKSQVLKVHTWTFYGKTLKFMIFNLLPFTKYFVFRF